MDIGTVFTLQNVCIALSSSHPSTFWIVAPNNIWTNNIAAGAKDSGYWYEIYSTYKAHSLCVHFVFEINDVKTGRKERRGSISCNMKLMNVYTFLLRFDPKATIRGLSKALPGATGFDNRKIGVKMFSGNEAHSAPAGIRTFPDGILMTKKQLICVDYFKFLKSESVFFWT